MSKTAKKKKPTADEIAEMAMSGKDISRYFTNKHYIARQTQG
jgi:hypothetical protein